MKYPKLALAISAVILCLGVAPASAQIAYVSVGGNGALQLRRMNADGSGDAAFALPFSVFLFPTWSRDGGLLAITATDPNRSPQKTQNVFAINMRTGGLVQLTNFHDQLDPQTNSFSYTFPWYKAFSPDRSALAINALAQTGGPNDTNDGGGVVNLPILEVHSLTVTANPILVHTDKQQNGKHHGGEGVDWSPTQNVLVAPLEGSAPFQSGGGPGEVTALALLEPVDQAVQKGRFRQITFPRADGQSGTSNDAFVWGEHDYQPKFSPNGRGVAYVRSFQNFFLLRNSAPDPDIQSLRIVDVQTGADTEVLRIPQGFYVTTVDWSPDGAQLVFDVGQQATGPLGPEQRAQPQTDEVYVVNVDGSGLQKVRAAGNGTPSWTRTAPPVPRAALGNISTRLRVGTGENALIGGFIVSGTQPKKIILRAIGPSLPVAGALQNPSLELHGKNGTTTNDNWGDAPNKQAIIDTTVAPKNDLESAILTTLPANNSAYTAVVRGVNNTTGVGLVEAFDLDAGADSTLANISTRGFVDSGDDVMIGGVIIGAGSTGSTAKVLVRAIGPSLTKQGVTGALQDPTLELRDANAQLIAQNDNWKTAQEQAIRDTTVPPTDDRESAIVKTLSAGNYTAIVRGKNNTTGVGLVELYNLQ